MSNLRRSWPATINDLAFTLHYAPFRNVRKTQIFVSNRDVKAEAGSG